MARRTKNVVKKTKSSTTKRNVTEANLSDFINLEHEIMSAPLAIITKIAKVIDAHKKKEAKLKKSIGKIKADRSKIDTKLKSFVKVNKTASVKNRVSLLKNKLADKIKEQAQLKSELDQLVQEIKLFVEQQSKYSALNKNLFQFQKDWNKKIKKQQATLLAKKKNIKTKKVAKPKLKKTKIAHKQNDFPHVESMVRQEVKQEELETIS